MQIILESHRFLSCNKVTYWVLSIRDGNNKIIEIDFAFNFYNVAGQKIRLKTEKFVLSSFVLSLSEEMRDS